MEVPFEEAAHAGPACPSGDELARLASGMIKEEAAGHLLDHIIECDHCGPLFRGIVDAATAETTVEEEEILAGLPEPDRVREDARALSRLSRAAGDDQAESGRDGLDVRAMAPIVVTIMAVAIGAWTVSGLLRTPDPARLLATSYSELRLIEYRIPGASYAPFRQKRGGALVLPRSYSEALVAIQALRKKNPDDKSVPRLAGQADLVAASHGAAIRNFEQALALDPNDREALSGQGAAVALRGAADDRPQDLRTARDLLRRSIGIRRTPDSTFNLALVYERLGEYQQASDAWSEFLNIETDPGWRAEAQKRRAEMENRQRP